MAEAEGAGAATDVPGCGARPLAATGCPAAVLALLHHMSREAAREALAGVLTAPDADVRAYAARGAVVNDA